ncbi:MAG: type II toxin-antitoxin system VapC family toxin [Rubrobacteraceae bacterium]
MIVLDASAAVAVLLNLGENARVIGDRMNGTDGEVHVPHLFEIEVLSALRRRMIGSPRPERSAQFVEDLTSMRLTRYPHTALLPRIWELRHNITTYDAAYVALAETLDAPLVTLDARLSQAPGIRAAVELYQ